MYRVLRLFFIFLTAFFVIVPFSVLAAEDHTTSYQTDYYIRRNGDEIHTDVAYLLTITNLRSDVYVKKFSLAFPDTFRIEDIRASDDKGAVEPVIAHEGGNIKVTLEFNDPAIGRGSVNTFRLNFSQDNLFKLNGNVWEVILPTIENAAGDYRAVVHLPPGDNKISVAKPLPDVVTTDEEVSGGRKVIWNNPKTRTIYAVFGDTQVYKTELTYNLSNSRLTPIYTEIALPPDTDYQKIFIRSLDPPPASVSQDEDGNYLARYFLGPRSTKKVIFNGFLEVRSQPREEVSLSRTESLSSSVRNKLLTPSKYWTIPEVSELGPLENPEDIHRFVVDNLRYDFNRGLTNNERLGAERVLETPDKAVCVEFSDLFVAIAREKGVLAREVQGYGFASDPRLRPLSLLSDVLHSWPEYYDESSRRWVPIDPTWENTSGIDYFSSFDLNHITFAIHGAKPDYPLPAGMYKTEQSKDISIEATEQVPSEVKRLVFTLDPEPKNLTDRETYKTSIRIENRGNSYAWNIPVSVSSDDLSPSFREKTIASLAPYEVKELPLTVTSLVKNRTDEAVLSIRVGETSETYDIAVTPYYYHVILWLAGVTFLITSVFVILRLLKKRHGQPL